MKIVASARLKIAIASAPVPFSLGGSAKFEVYEEDTLNTERLGFRITHKTKIEEVSKETLINAKV